MAASDNVLRGGLTSKFVDIPELAKILQFKPFCPEIIYPSEEAVFRYPVACDDFALYLVRGEGEIRMVPGSGCKPVPGSILVGRNCLEPGTRQSSIKISTHPTICIVTEGEVLIDGIVFKKGESFFIPGGEPLRFSGNFSLYAACSS
jgi:mannose-6-phosphate isomerase